MTTKSKLLFARLCADRRGVTAVFLALGATMFMGFGAIVVDVGYIFHAKRVLQASADAAALAGAMRLSTGTPAQAVTTATSYSGGSGGMNVNANLSITANPQTVNCSGQNGSTCTVTASSPNGIKVTETASAQTYFARIFGINSVPISTTAFALQSGGKAQNYDIMIILDTTASMNSSDSSCSGNSRLNCAFNGFRALLQGFTPPTQQVGLMIFPGLKTRAEAAQEYDCSSSSPGSSSIAAYNASASAPTTTPPVYLIVPLSSDYKSGSSLNTSSNLVIAARGGGSGCTAGVSAYGGVGTFYADAITAADAYLDANARTGSHKMIILLSDGDATASSGNMTSGKVHNQCHEAITASTTAQSSDGATVVTIAYGSPGSGSCSTDSSPSITACNALMGMASVGNGTTSAPQWFYADSTSACTSGHSATNLNAIFTAVGTDISAGGARLIPNS